MLIRKKMYKLLKNVASLKSAFPLLPAFSILIPFPRLLGLE